ncbi:kinase-like domain-containing protein [Xylaria palmicola]|nr:kinase-like domain-containing protein [Xylaria palmicola]
MSRSLAISAIPQSYQDDDASMGSDERQPYRRIKCSQRYLFTDPPSQWHVKITFEGVFPSSDLNSTWLQRKKDFEQLCRSLNFGSLSLLNDTVTEIILSYPLVEPDDTRNTINSLHISPLGDCNIFTPVVHQLQISIQEDPTRVRFPLCDNYPVPTIDLNIVKNSQELAAGVHLVHIANDTYVYKEINRPLYMPNDTEVLLQELQNLQILRDTKGIVQLSAVVTSVNPYRTLTTGQNNEDRVLQGLLLEYHSKGTLQDALVASGAWPWIQWALQIASSLHQMHQHGLTHMDIKPSNIVISANLEATLIDVSGRAYSQDWLSPEMRHLEDPPSQEFFPRVMNDIWAFGKIALRMADASSNKSEQRLLMTLHSDCTTTPLERTSLCRIIAMLENYIQESKGCQLKRWLQTWAIAGYFRLFVAPANVTPNTCCTGDLCAGTA